MLRVSLTPGVHLVPAAMLMAADHWPEAHLWKLVPPIQFQAPSLLQAPVCVPEAPPEAPPPAPPVAAGCAMLVVEVATGTDEDAGTEGAGEDTAAEDEVADEDAGSEADVAVMSVVGVAALPVVRKTPPVGVL